MEEQGSPEQTAFSSRVRVPDNVMFRELEGESVILDLDGEAYFGLDEIGTRMWLLLTESTSIQEAYESLIDEYEVEPGQLRGDLAELVEHLVKQGLLQVDAN